MFQHPREAQRAPQDRVVLLAMMQGGWKMGWRFGLVTGVFLSVTQSLSVIRNSINPLDYAAGGLAMGAVYRFNMGPRGIAQRVSTRVLPNSGVCIGKFPGRSNKRPGSTRRAICGGSRDIWAAGKLSARS